MNLDILRTKSAAAAWAVIALAATFIILPATFKPMWLHDSFWLDHVWVSQFTAQLGEGVLYPRWLPWSHDGLGSPVFYYYPPLAFYVSGLFGLAGLSTYGSILAAFATSFFVGGIGAFYWLRDRTDYPLPGALFFTLSPYHCFDYYGRGAIAETVAIAFLPFLAIGLRRIAEGRSWVPAAIAYAAIIFSHLPLALLTSLFLIAPYALVHRRHLLGFALACAFGIGLAAIYLVPAFGLEPFRDTGQLWVTRFLRPSYWSLYAGNWDVPLVIQFHLTIAVLAVPALVYAIGARSRPAIYAAGIIVIAFGLIPYLWSLPIIRDVQFPYRILPLAELGLAAAIATRSSFSPAVRAAAVALPLVWTAVSTAFPHGPAPTRHQVEQQHLDVAEYLPRGAKTKPNPTHWYQAPREGRVPPPVVQGWIVRPSFYYPAWSCGREEPNTKLLMHRPGCEPEIRLTIYEKVGGWISLAALLALLIFAQAQRQRPSRALRMHQDPSAEAI